VLTRPLPRRTDPARPDRHTLLSELPTSFREDSVGWIQNGLEKRGSSVKSSLWPCFVVLGIRAPPAEATWYHEFPARPSDPSTKCIPISRVRLAFDGR